MTAKEILDKLISQEPQSTKEKYVFLVGDNEHLYKQIMAARYIALQMDADQLEVYLDKDLYYTESHIKDYIWVTCAEKAANETMNAFFESEEIPYKQGWLMVKQLGDTPTDEAVKAALEKFTAAEDSSMADLPTYYDHKPHNTSQYIDNLLIADIGRMKAAGSRKTGFPVLDKLSNGLYAGLYVIAATSSLGKTTLALQVADNLAAAGHDILFFSLEQSRLELVTKSFSRLLKQENNESVSSLTLRTGADSNSLQAAAKLYKSKIGDRMNIIEGNFGCNIDYISAYVREYISKNGTSPIIFVDYLQILQPSAEVKASTTRESIDQTVTALKRLSRDYGLTVFIISSVNRSNYMQPIDFESLKESGGIEYTADVIWGLQLQCLNEELFNEPNKIKNKRERIREAKSANPRQIELVCLKNRFGVANFTCKFEYMPDCDLFTQETEGFNKCYNSSFDKKPTKRL
jgi:replicative DNA helicase|nr:MAG TPA: DnaB-like replicative helicase [Bacteriophage sp.]